VVFGRYGSDLLLEKDEVGALPIGGGEFAAMKDGDGVGDARDEVADGEAVAADVDAAAATGGEVFGEAVGLVEGEGDLPGGNLEADMAEVVDGGEVVMGDLIDIEGELGLDVLVLALGVADGIAIAGAEPGELDGYGEVGGGAVADGVADVVGKGADGEGEFVGVPGVAEEVDDKVSRSDVVGEVREEGVAEGIVADVLDDAAAIGEGAGVLELGGGEGGVAAEQKRDDGALPGEIDELLVGEQGIGAGGALRGEGEQKQGSGT